MVHTFRFEFRLSSGGARWLLAALVMIAAADDLASESLTLTTYYPAPLGVYASLITTGVGGVNTILARDAGQVGIGTASPADKLTVTGDGNGRANIGGGYCGGDYTGISLNGSTGNCTVYNILSSPSDPQLYINRQSGYQIRFREGNGDQMTIASGGKVGINTTSPSLDLDIAGPTSPPTFGHNSGPVQMDLWGSYIYDTGTGLHLASGSGWTTSDSNFTGNIIQAGQYVHLTNGASGCYQAYDNQGCAGGYYATWAPGLYVENLWYGFQFPFNVSDWFWVNPNPYTTPVWNGVGTMTVFYCCPG